MFKKCSDDFDERCLQFVVHSVVEQHFDVAENFSKAFMKYYSRNKFIISYVCEQVKKQEIAKELCGGYKEVSFSKQCFTKESKPKWFV